MDGFEVREQLIRDYSAFTSGFVDVRDRRIKGMVVEQRDRGDQWPEPRLSLNPSFESGGSMPQLVLERLLEPEYRHRIR